MPDLYTHFRSLQLAYRHIPRGRVDRRMWSSAQVELFHLAQVIASRECPSIQSALTEARRAVMHHLIVDTKDPSAPCSMGQSRRPMTWDRFQLTPEISHDPSLSAIPIPDPLARDLLTLHAAQVQAVLRAMRTTNVA